MDRVYQYASLNMGWCISCHVNGYSPKEGLEAAGYAPLPGGAAAPAAVADTAARKKARYDCANCHY
jgi:mono/diheme cytochrome c family protein